MAASSWIWAGLAAGGIMLAVLVLRLFWGRRARVNVVTKPGGKLKIEVRHVPKNRR